MSFFNKLTIGQLRQLVPQKQAWRELLGREEFLKLYRRYKNYDMRYVDSVTSAGKKIDAGDIKLKDTIKGKCVSLSPYSTEIHISATNMTFYGKEITLENIVKKINDFERKAVSLLDTPRSLEELEPKMLKKLFSPKYKPIRRVNEEGFPVTTVIDRQTQEPVEVFIRLKSAQPDSEIQVGNGLFRKVKKDSRVEEIYEMYIKNPHGEPELIGDRSFRIDMEKKVIAPGNMKAYGNDRYEGIGTRLHQLAVERMLQNDFKAVEISSLSTAFPFHYKSLFRVKPYPEMNTDINTIMSKFKYFLDERLAEEGYKQLSYEQIENCLAETSQKGVFDFSKTYENIKKLLFQKRITISFGDVPMILDGKNLEYWVELAKTQPILLK